MGCPKKHFFLQKSSDSLWFFVCKVYFWVNLVHAQWLWRTTPPCIFDHAPRGVSSHPRRWAPRQWGKEWHQYRASTFVLFSMDPEGTGCTGLLASFQGYTGLPRHRKANRLKGWNIGPWKRWKGESFSQNKWHFFHAATQNVNLLVLLFLISFCVSSMIFGHFNSLVGWQLLSGKRRRFQASPARISGKSCITLTGSIVILPWFIGHSSFTLFQVHIAYSDPGEEPCIDFTQWIVAIHRDKKKSPSEVSPRFRGKEDHWKCEEKNECYFPLFFV